MIRGHALRLAAIGIAMAVIPTACDWQGANSIPLPGTQGRGRGAYTIDVQLADIDTIEQNSRVQIGDVTVGTVTNIRREGWHALLTLAINADVNLPANSTAAVGQTSLLGTRHISLAPPKGTPQGQLRQGSLIPLSSTSVAPTVEKTLAAVSMLFNGGGIGQVQEITQALSTAFSGRENDLRSLINQTNTFITNLNGQIDDIIAATDSMNRLVSQLADQKPILDTALKTIPEALAVVNDERQNFVDAFDMLGKFSALAADAVRRTKSSLVKEFNELGPVLQSLADSGPALTRSLSLLSTFPWVTENIPNWFRGDLANVIAIFDFTLSRLDQALFTGTRWEGNLTELEMQWGRTIGQLPSPYTAANPLVAPYRNDQGR